MLTVIQQQNLKLFLNRLEKSGLLNWTKKLTKQFPKAEVYLVGGAIRDALLNNQDNQDFDFVVRNVPVKNLEKFLKKEGSVNLVGQTFGVFKFVPKGIKTEALDIALPRTEHSLGLKGGYKDFAIKSNPYLPITADLARRDFTINAFALLLKQKSDLVFIDHFAGLKDLQAKKIRAVGTAQLRFKEDYTRILRALRFACQLNFAIETKTFSALKRLTHHLNDLDQQSEYVTPRELIAKELVKAFLKNPARALDLWLRSNALKNLLPEIENMRHCPQPKNYHSEGNVFKHTALALEYLQRPEFTWLFKDNKISPNLVFATLLHDVGKPPTLKYQAKKMRYFDHEKIGAEIATDICQRLKLPSAGFNLDTKKIAWLIQYHLLLIHGRASEMRAATIEKYFFSADYPGEDLLKLTLVDALATIPYGRKPVKSKSELKNWPNLQGFFELQKRFRQLKKLAPRAQNQLPPPLLNGYKIMKELKIKSGPKVGQVLTLLREAQLNGRIKNKAAAIKFIKTCQK